MLGVALEQQTRLRKISRQPFQGKITKEWRPKEYEAKIIEIEEMLAALPVQRVFRLYRSDGKVRQTQPVSYTSPPCPRDRIRRRPLGVLVVDRLIAGLQIFHRDIKRVVHYVIKLTKWPGIHNTHQNYSLGVGTRR
jgi:hypothetical protein